MKVVVKVGIGLQPPEVGKKPLKAPLVIAEGSPGVVVLGHPRKNTWPLMALDPPVTLPAGTCIGSALSVDLPTKFQLCWPPAGAMAVKPNAVP